ncbi:hypothetical protein JCM5350_008315 [Sporobolomyces pararoseus]
MNSLPPELLSSIIELAADCTSVYESWDTRMDTLLSLTLVNKTFHNIAQLLIPEKFFFREDDDVVGEPFEEFMRSEVTTNIKSLAFEPQRGAYCYNLPILFGFENLTQLRLKLCTKMSLQTFKAHRHLSRLAVYDGYFLYDPETDSNIALPSLVELSFEKVSLVMYGSPKAGATPPVLSESHVPSLKTLGVAESAGRPPKSFDHQDAFSDSLLTRLDCLTTDNVPLQTAAPDLPIPVPFLLDIVAERPSISPSSCGISRALVFQMPSPSHSHHRIRLPSERNSSDEEDIKSALEFAYKLVKESTILEELYLDLYPRDGRRVYVSKEASREEIKQLEEIAREENVEILWENHEDDWCRSRVSKEFWRRCKEKKEKELREG